MDTMTTPAPTTATVVTSADGTRLAVDIFGDGTKPALIIVPGATATKAAASASSAYLSNTYTVYAYDRRGRGDSGDTAPFAVEREIEDLAAVVALAGDDALVLGHSSGAVLALRAAAAGVPMARLAVYEPPFITDASRPPVPTDYVEHLDALIAEDKREEAAVYFMTDAVGMPEEMVEGIRAAGYLAMTIPVAHTIAYDGRIMGETMRGNPLAAEPWQQIAVPTLVMAGGASMEYMRKGARELTAIIPNATMKVLDGQDHGPSDESLAEALADFLP
jgi:pimeloyl-ACP methyl ester carboxylesterase